MVGVTHVQERWTGHSTGRTQQEGPYYVNLETETAQWAHPLTGQIDHGDRIGLVDSNAMSSLPYPLLPPEMGTLDGGGTRKSPQHGFIQAITTAFAEHWPLALRPEHIWTLVLQAVARHVDENTEELRERFVAHEGKATLEVPYSEE